MYLTIWIYCRENNGQQATSEPPPKKIKKDLIEDVYQNYKLRIWLQALKISHKVKGVPATVFGPPPLGAAGFDKV